MSALALALCLAAAAPPAPAGADPVFAEANAAFLSGDFARATALYQALLSEGTASPELETNLAAALQRQGKRGAAVLHLERALRLDPSDDDARADLAELRKGNVDRLEGDADSGGGEALLRVLGPLPARPAALAFLVLWTLAWAAWGLRLWAQALLRKVPLGPIAAALFSAAALAGLVAAGGAEGERLALRRAVVVAPSAAAREGPDARAASPFEVHEGTSVRVDDRQSGFARIRLGNGLSGWVEQAAIEPVVPPAWGGLSL